MRVCPRCHAHYDANVRFCQTDAATLIDLTDFQRIGTTVGNYRLLGVIGRGGMGTVFRGEHVYIGKPVAMKILHERFARYEDSVQRFLREARAASSINHPNIVDVTDFGPTADGGVFFVMEYLGGESLEDVIEREAPLALHRSINVMNQLASALAAAHDKGIIHRDLKPENILLVPREGRREVIRTVDSELGALQRFVVEPEQTFDFVKILDFGIAKVMEPETTPSGQAMGATIAGTIFGTPEYMSPEAAKGQPVDHRADIYSLGIIFYDMLTGRVPFRGNTPVEVLAQHIANAPIPPSVAAPGAEITEAAEQLIMRALSKDPGERQQSMGELRDELASCFGSVAYRRDAHRIPGAVESGVVPRRKRLTEELDEWLRANQSVLDVARQRLEAIVASAPQEVAHASEVASPGFADAESGTATPLLLTQKKPK